MSCTGKGKIVQGIERSDLELNFTALSRLVLTFTFQLLHEKSTGSSGFISGGCQGVLLPPLETDLPPLGTGFPQVIYEVAP